jgi:phage shock protein E
MRSPWLVTFALLFTAPTLGCDESARPPKAASAAPAAAPADPVAAAKAAIAAGATVIDVREQSEWDEGHLPQAKLVPVGSVGDKLAEIEALAGGKDKPIVLYCRSGSRAGHAKRTLESAGFTNIINGGGYRKLAAP